MFDALVDENHFGRHLSIRMLGQVRRGIDGNVIFLRLLFELIDQFLNMFQ